MVRGVVYFGTPFQGSLNADFTAPFANLVGTFTRSSTNYLGEMRTSHANKLAPLMMGFNNIRNEEEIEVLVFVEKLSDGPTRVVSSKRPDSASKTNLSSRQPELRRHYHSLPQLCPSELTQTIETW